MTENETADNRPKIEQVYENATTEERMAGLEACARALRQVSDSDN